jgi:hypothetical protein
VGFRVISWIAYYPERETIHEITRNYTKQNASRQYLELNPIDSRNSKAGSLFILKIFSGFLETICHWHFYLNILEKRTVQRQAT